MEILIAVLTFGVGVLVGVGGTWWWMNREWKRNPYQFKMIIDGVIARREARVEKGDSDGTGD